LILPREGGGAMRMEEISLKSSQPLTEDYVQQFAKVSALYDYNPWDEAAWKARATYIDQERPAGSDRNQLADALKSFQEKVGGAEEALQAVELLRDPRSLVIVGGQQAGHLTGPLLVVYKAITVIHSAKLASERLQRPVIPVFWIAGEDHDFDEVNHIYTLTPEQQLEKLKLEHPTGVRTSISRLEFQPEQWTHALEQLDATLLPTEFKPELLSKLHSYAAGSTTLVDFFARIIAGLFSQHGLVVMDSDDPGLRRLEAPMFQTLIERSDELNRSLLKTRELQEQLGYPPAAEWNERGTNLFVFDEQGERILLHRGEEGVWTDRRGERRFTSEQLLDWAVTDPSRLSNNVMTRPLMQDYLLPVLGAVLGPSEIAYWGLTGGAFHLLGMKMPLLLPRLGFTLVEGTIHKNMQKYGLTMEDVLYRLQEKQEAWLKEQDQLQLDDRFAGIKQRFREDYEPLIATVAGINPGLKKLGETNLAKILEQIDFLENKAADAVRSQFDAGLRQFQRIGVSIVPNGIPQERIYNVYAYLNKYGDGWLKELLDTPLAADGKHRICYL
jgi:bacillithiol synthase